MYPITQGYSEVCSRLDTLQDNGHQAESMLASTFVFEKTAKRIVRFGLINRGFTTKHCDAIFGRGGFEHIKTLYDIFDRDHKTLQTIVTEAHWSQAKEAITWRNKIVHGERVYPLEECAAKVPHIRAAIDNLRDDAIARLSCDPWSRFPTATKSKLIWLNIPQPSPTSPSSPITD